MTPDDKLLADDVRALHRLGYAQELARCLGAFSNFAISFSIICILAGGITSFHLGFCSVGGAAIGIGWPLVALFALIVAATMAQIASAFPTAGGLYHWASILGGRGWGWMTAWFNLAGLVTVLAAINVGAFEFASRAFFPEWGDNKLVQFAVVLAMTASQALVNHLGIRLTSRLTDLSGFLIFIVALALTVTMFALAARWDWSRLVTFTNYGGALGEQTVWPEAPTALLFVLGFMLPAYTITGFDASAHAAEETVGAERRVPRGIVGAVLASGIAGWIMLCAVVLAIPDMDEAAQKGARVFHAILDIVPPTWRAILFAAIFTSQYLCGLATVTSASRMAFAFARDGGLPASKRLAHVDPTHRTPVLAIWTVALASILFTLLTPVYETITAVCTIFLYISYAVPIALGLVAHGRWWTRMGPWQLGVWYRPLALVSVIGCAGMIAIGVHPPNDSALYVILGVTALLVGVWFAVARRHFHGPPLGVLDKHRLDEIQTAEAAVRQLPVAHEGESG